MNNSSGSFMGSMPAVTKNLLFINAIIWLGSMVLKQNAVDITSYLGLHYWGASKFNPAQLITYMFLHDTSSWNNGFMHIFFNMFSLWMFGCVIERVVGAKKYLFYYISCGLGAALAQEIVWTITWQSQLAFANSEGFVVMKGAQAVQYAIQTNQLEPFLNQMVTIGASGAVFGILLAFGMLFPNVPLYLFFIPIPIKAKWMVIGYGAIELFFGVSGSIDNVAHFAHLGGMIIGIFIILYWKKKGVIGGGGVY